jgi:hypothetical protein
MARKAIELRLQHGTITNLSRFIFPDHYILDLPLEEVGLGEPLIPKPRGVLGVSLLQHFGVQLTYRPTPTLTLSEGVPDTNQEIAAECDPAKLLAAFLGGPTESCTGFFRVPLVGSGRIQLGGELVELPPSRQVVSTCLMPDEFTPQKDSNHGAESATGISLMGVMATGQGPSIISRSAFEHLRRLHPSLQAAPPATYYYAGGSIKGSPIKIPRLALVSHETNELDPCAELALRRRLLISERVELPRGDRVLLQEKQIAGANVALVSSEITFLIIDDQAPLLQGLRKEVQPFRPSIDLILGGSFLRFFNLIIDYPTDRLFLRCTEGTPLSTCHVLPWCSNTPEQTPRCPYRAER